MPRRRRHQFKRASTLSIRRSEIPALRVGDQKIAKRLNARNGFQLFRINEIGVERDGIALAEQRHQSAVLFDQIIRQHRDTEPALTGAQNTEDVVDDEMRYARSLAVARDLY